MSNIVLDNGEKIKIAKFDGEEFISLEGSELQKLEKTFGLCTFCLIFLTKLFVEDKWSRFIGESFLMKTINSEEKKWCVVPIYTAPRQKLGFEIPLGLNALREIKFYGKLSNYFFPCMKSLINGRLDERINKERKVRRKKIGPQQNSYIRSLPEVMTACTIGSRNPNKEREHTNDIEVDGGATNNMGSPTTKKTPNIDIAASTGQGCFQKKYDDKDYTRNIRLVAHASKSVGLVCIFDSAGTGFRVGSKYIATARHVIANSAVLGNNGEIDVQKLRSKKCYVRFEYLQRNEITDSKCVFFFHNVAYDNKLLDTIIIEMKGEVQGFPPPIPMISKLNKDNNVYLISHNNGEPQTLDPKIEFYTLKDDDVKRSIKWAKEMRIDLGRGYTDAYDNQKVLFHCAVSHGASGALGVMVDQHLDMPQGVLMVIRGYPDFLYGNQSFSDEEKARFLIVEQGVLLSSVYDEIKSQEKYKDLVEDINHSLSSSG